MKKFLYALCCLLFVSTVVHTHAYGSKDIYVGDAALINYSVSSGSCNAYIVGDPSGGFSFTGPQTGSRSNFPVGTAVKPGTWVFHCDAPSPWNCGTTPSACDSATLNVSCPPSTSWNGTSCAVAGPDPKPNVTFTVTPNSLPSGLPAGTDFTYTLGSSGAQSCQIIENPGSAVYIDKSLNLTNPPPIVSKTGVGSWTYTATCYSRTNGGGTASDPVSVSVKVNPSGGASCPAGPLNWTVGGNTCNAVTAFSTIDGDPAVVTDSVAPTTGDASFACTNGTFGGALPGSTCNLSCPSGQYPSGGSCVICTPGNYCPGGTSGPIICTINSYCPTGSPSPTSCSTVGAGYTSPAGSSKSTDCSPPPVGGCSNGAIDPGTCKTCPLNSGLYWDGANCSNCTNGGCASCNASQSSPVNGCRCNNGGANPPVCTPPVGSCSNGAIDPGTCKTCPLNSGLHWNGSSCVPCSNGGCSTCNASQSSPVNGCSCNNGGVNPPTCTPPSGSCSNGAINPGLCNICPPNSGLHWNGSSCVPCSNGGCSTCNASQASPVNGCSCNNGGVNPPTCTPPSGSCSNGATNPPTCNSCSAGDYLDGGSCHTCPANSSSAAGAVGVSSCACLPGYGGSGGVCTPAGIHVTPTNLYGVAPGAAVTLNYSIVTDNFMDVECRLLDNAGVVYNLDPAYDWVHFRSGSGPIGVKPYTVTIPSAVGVYLYRGECRDEANHSTIGGADLLVNTVGIYPDLVAGAISPITAVTNVPVVLTARITNIGNGATQSGNFFNFMQEIKDSSGMLNNIFPAKLITRVLAGYGDSDTFAVSYTFPTPGLYHVRACADKQNPPDLGDVDEGAAGEMNNCGDYYAPTSGDWTDVLVSDPVSGGPSSGSITASPSSCAIATGNSTCNTTLTWSTVSPVATSIVTRDRRAGNLYTGNNSPVGGQLTAVPYDVSGIVTYRLKNNGSELDSTTVAVNCSAGGTNWDTVDGVCADPQVGTVVVTDDYLPTGSVDFSCINSNGYTVKNQDTGVTIATRSGYSGPWPKSIPVSITGNYSVVCKYGTVVSLPRVVIFHSPPPPAAAISLDIYPKTISAGGKSTASWEITWPLPACTLTATPVCANSICSASSTAAAEALNRVITSSYVDTSSASIEPRSIRTALTTIAPGHSADHKAVGQKTFTITNTTDFTVNCGAGIKATSRVRVTTSGEQ